MLTVSQIMTPEPVSVGPETSLRDVIDVLSVHRISGVPVVSASGRIVGVVSASDILAFTASMAGVPDDAEGGDPDEDDGDDDPWTETLAGYWDDTGADVVTRVRADWRPDWDRLDEHTVSEAMTRRLHTIAPAAGIAEAAAHMVSAGIHRLLVVDDGQLVGMISTMDFVKAIARDLVHV